MTWLTCGGRGGGGGGWGGVGSRWWLLAFCSLTVDLWARPLSSSLFVGGADGVSDCREGLKQGGRDFKIRKQVLTVGAAPNKSVVKCYQIIKHRCCIASSHLPFITWYKSGGKFWNLKAELRAIFCTAPLHHHITMHTRRCLFATSSIACSQ